MQPTHNQADNLQITKLTANGANSQQLIEQTEPRANGADNLQLTELTEQTANKDNSQRS